MFPSAHAEHVPSPHAKLPAGHSARVTPMRPAEHVPGAPPWQPAVS